MDAIEVKVTITKMDGTLLETLVVSGEYLRHIAVCPRDMVAHAIVEAIEEQFETKDE